MRRDPDRLRDVFDLVVLGAGCTGAGVALDAAARGLRVALIDKGDFASGTSSASTKLVHGGLRYLERGDVALVYEALHERRRLLHNAPHLVTPLRFVIPFYRGAAVPGWKFRAGLLLYDVLAGPGNLRRSRGVSVANVLGETPLRAQGLLGGASYFDARMDDARLCLEIVRTAHDHGAAVCNYVEVVAFEDRQCLRCVDRVSGQSLTVSGRVILNAAGPWSDVVRRLAGEEAGPRLSPTKGVHLIAPSVGLTSALLLLHPRDGRVFFVLPWLNKTLIGTTDTEAVGSPDDVSATDDDVTYLLDGYNHFLRTPLTPADVLGRFAGVRPLLAASKERPSARSREWKLLAGPTGMLSAVGGKWTTYRRMAETITDAVMARLGRRGACRTRSLSLGAPRDGVGALVTSLCQRFGLTHETAAHLASRYGRRAGDVARLLTPKSARPVVEGEPDLLVELAYQREHEMAAYDEDCLLRRTRLGLMHPHLLRRRT